MVRPPRWTVLRIAACAALAASIGAGCGRRAEPERPASGGTLRIAVFESVDPPSPLWPGRPALNQIFEHVVPPLGRIDEQNEVRPLLARDYVDTGARMDFALRPVRWEDGTPVGPDDLALTARFLADTRLASPERPRMDLVRGATAADDSTFRLEFATIYARRVRDALLAPLPSHRLPAGIDRDALRAWEGFRRPLACGPFRVAAASHGRLVLVRNDRAGWPAVRLDSVVVTTADTAAVAAAFRRGALDVVDGMPPWLVPEARRLRGTRVVALVGKSYLFVGWNLRDGRFSDPEVRRAAALAIDVDRMVRERTLGQGERARGPLVPIHAFTDTTRLLPHDRRAAMRLLDGAGWRDTDGDGVRERRGARLAFHLLAPSDDPLRLAVARGVARDLGRIGCAVEVRPLPVQQLVRRLEAHAFEAFVGQWFPDPGLDLDPVWRSDATDQFNYGGYASSASDSLLTRMHHETTSEARERVLARFQARVYADQPYLFLFLNPQFVVFGPRVRGAEPSVVSPFWNLPEWWIAAPPGG